MTSREDFPGTDEWYESRGLRKPDKKKERPKQSEPITAYTNEDEKYILQRLSGLVYELSNDLNIGIRTIHHIIVVNIQNGRK